MQIAEHIEALDRDGALLGDAAGDAGLTAAVPTCPGWLVSDLIRHQAYVHGWAARHVSEQRAEIIDGADEQAILSSGPPDGELVAWYRAGHAELVRVLRAADPDVQCATFLPAPSPLAFWARRQAHETAIHRFDAQAARQAGPPAVTAAFEPRFADDGVDELIMGFAARRRYRLRGEASRSLAILAADTGGRWHVEMLDGATTVRRGDGAADCTLEGPAAGLYAFLWNRADAVSAAITVTGDSGILATWGSSVRVTWS